MGGRAVETGERTYLRRPTPGDRGEFLARARASRRLHRPWLYAPMDDAGFEEYLRRSRRRQNACFLVCRIEDGAIAGAANLSQIFYGALRGAYLGFYAFAPFERQGLMTEGLRLVLRQAFGPLGLHRVEANVQPGNEASTRSVERLGFRREGYSPRYLKIGGRWRDHVRFAILAEDFSTLEAERRARARRERR